VLERESFTDPWTARQIEMAVDDDAVIAIIAQATDGALMGYVLARAIEDEGEILSITAGPAFRRKGVGRRLLDAAISELHQRGARTAWLEVRRSNAAAHALYLGAGFVATGVRKAYYQRPPEDAIVLRRALPLTALRGPREG